MIRYFIVGEMAGCLTAIPSSTPDELVEAYTSDNEEFYGVDEQEMISESESSDSDEDELGSSSDIEPDTWRQSFGEHDSDEVLIVD